MAELEIIVGALAAVVLFLYGIENLSTEIQRTASDRFRGILSRAMGNRWAGAASGALVTSVIQSSTATTVIAVGLVNSGLITFSQSLGIIAGANIGTTITAQLVAFNLFTAAPYFLISGFLLSVFGGKYRFVGKSIFYFGLVFFSIMLLSNVLAPLKNDPDLITLFVQFDDPLVAILFGFAVTAIFQSSSVTTGIIVLLGMQGFLNLEQAIPAIMGANMGTTITAILASYNMEVFARRTAVAHLLFNVVGVLIFLPLIPQFAFFVKGFGGSAGQMIANAHLIFNVASAIVFLMLADKVAAFISQLMKTNKPELIFKPKYLNGRLPGRMKEAVGIIIKEIEYELELVVELFSTSLQMAKAADSKELQRAAKLEMLTDLLDEKISDALRMLSTRKLGNSEAVALSRLARISNEIEQLADLGEGIAHLAKKMGEKSLRLHPVSHAELSEVDALLSDNLSVLKSSMQEFSQAGLLKAKRNGARISRIIEKSYHSHIKRMKEDKPAHYAGTYFTDLMAILEAANAKVVSIMGQRRALEKNMA